MKKIILVIALLLFASGCDVVYNLDIDNELYKENLLVSTSSESKDYENVKNYYWPKPIDYTTTGYSESPRQVEGITYYNYENTSNDKLASFSYFYDMNEIELKNSAIIHNCYLNFNIYENEDDKTKTISTSNEFLCFSKYPPLENVTINLTTKENVVEHNADSYSGNTYTWKINKLTAKNKPIRIVTGTQIKEESENFTLLFIIIGGFLLIIVIIFVYKYRKSNSQ